MSIGRTGPPDTAPVVEDAIKYAVGKGVFVAIAGGNEFEDGNPTEVLAEIASRVQGAVSVAAVDRNATAATRMYRHRIVTVCHAPSSAAAGWSWRRRADPSGSSSGDGFIWQQTYDFNFVETFVLPPAQYRAPRFDVLAFVGYIGHVDGDAARRGLAAHADAAGHHRSGGHRSGARALRHRSGIARPRQRVRLRR